MKKVLSILLAICMVLATVPMMSVTIFAADEHTHCICGGAKGVGDHTSHEDVTYTAWTATDSLPSTAGNYYLTADVTLSSTPVRIYNKDINLCLNGHTVTLSDATWAYEVSYKVNLTITDCTGAGKFDRASGTTGTFIKLDQNTTTPSSTVKLFNIDFENGTGYYSNYGGAICGDNSSSSCKLPRLSIYNCDFVNNSATYTGGAIYYYAGHNGEEDLKIYNSNFSGNSARGGGAVAAIWSSAIIDGCTFSGNKSTSTSTSSGGSALWVSSDNSKETNLAYISNCTFTGNTSTNGYGTVYLASLDNKISDITVTNNTNSSTNTDVSGGVYASKSLTLSGCNVITGNTCNSKARNLYLVSALTAEAEDLDSFSDIGLSFYGNTSSSFSSQTLVTADKTGYGDCFTSDLSTLQLREDDSGSIIAYKPVDPTKITVSANGTVPTTDKAGETLQLKVTATPSNADNSVTWTSSNTAVATVSDTGLVTVVAAGTTTITATSTAKTSVKGTYTLTLGHSFTNYVSNNDATCTADGTKTAKCDNCDATSDKIADEGSKLGHSFTTYTYNNDATCTADGTKTAKCDRCDATDKITDEGTKLGHSFTNYVYNNDATCTADGTKTAKCDRCDATDTITAEGTKLAHSFTNYVYNNDATCTADGTKTAKCDNCDATDTITAEGTALGHSFTNYVYNNDATCTADGTETAKCDRCDVTDTITAEGTKLGHSFTTYVYNNDATCTKDGTETAKCDRCDVTDTRTAAGTALGHVDADGDSVCDRCGETLCHWCIMVSKTTSCLQVFYKCVDVFHHFFERYLNLTDFLK